LLIVTSRNKNPKHLRKSIEKLKKLQRKVSKKQKGSSNRKKSIVKLAKLHEKVANQRLDFYIKLLII
jgi:putative transposase